MYSKTHAHADHLSSSQIYKEDFPEVKVAVGENIREVQETFKGIYNLGNLAVDGSQFDQLLKEGEVIEAGTIKFKVINTPGHTPACVSYLVDDALFTGDAIFMPDYGTGRCDFPGGDAKQLYNSISRKLYELPDSTRVFVGHDYLPNGRELKYESTIGEQKASNIHLTGDTTEEQFVEMREGRDKTLKAPRLLFPSIQVNVQAGSLPDEESNGMSYLKIPLFKEDK